MRRIDVDHLAGAVVDVGRKHGAFQAARVPASAGSLCIPIAARQYL
jgi:hypothetical protein